LRISRVPGARIHYTSEAEKLIGERGTDWVHFDPNAQVPPTVDGSYNFLIWDIVQSRSGRDVVICPYLPDSFGLAEELGEAVIQIEELEGPSRKRNLPHRLLRYAFSRIFKSSSKKNRYSRAASLIRETKCEKVLVWSQIGWLPRLREELPFHTIAFAQRHYDHPAPQLAYEVCDLLITQTRGQISFAYEHHKMLSPFVVTIPNGARLDVFYPATEEKKRSIRKGLSVSSDRFVVIFPSKLVQYKGTRYLLKWIEHFRAGEPDILFLVVGKLYRLLEVRHRNELEETLPASSNVLWLGGVSRDEMPDLYRAADLCLIPSVVREGFSMSAVEALASGLPIIAPDIGIFPEIMRNGYNGFLCPRERLFEDVIEAIGLLSEDKELLSNMSRNARNYAERRLRREKVLANFNAFLEGRYADIDDDISIPDG